MWKKYSYEIFTKNAGENPKVLRLKLSMGGAQADEFSLNLKMKLLKQS